MWGFYFGAFCVAAAYNTVQCAAMARTRITPSVLKKSISIAVGASLAFSPATDILSWNHSPMIFAVYADSTGKFSTKLTAKKRYLPRVVQGALEFKRVYKDSVKLSAFYAEDFKSLLRAMDLYGASLRKGEVPDETSRQARVLTDEFEVKVNKLVNAPNSEKLKLSADSLQALESYLQFAKISIEDVIKK